MAKFGSQKKKVITQEERVVSLLKEKFPELKPEIPYKQRVRVRCPKERLHEVVGFLKESGFDHLSMISCVDFIEENEFELVYHLWSYRRRVHAMVKIRIDRERAEFDTLIPLWEHAETYEREIHEMFGVVFHGNHRLTPFILEDWDGPPPMRRDFNTRNYVKKKIDSIPEIVPPYPQAVERAELKLKKEAGK